MTGWELALLYLAWLIGGGSPGPATLALASTGMARGRRAALALAGALHGIGPADRPPPLPLNLIGDFGGGAMYLVAGLLAAMIEAGRSGKGQVVDAARSSARACSTS